jgi:anti-anti-sigma factor
VGCYDDKAASVRVVEGDGKIVVWIQGDLDLANANSVDAAVRAAMHGDRTRVRPVVDLSGIAFVDSAGLRVLVGIAERRDAQFRNPPARVRRLFELAGLQALFDIH